MVEKYGKFIVKSKSHVRLQNHKEQRKEINTIVAEFKELNKVYSENKDIKRTVARLKLMSDEREDLKMHCSKLNVQSYELQQNL